ncbi:MAG: glutathione-disulfide reductase [Xanthomonadales bacterium]|nr:glutathione-disulfide reductase [Xanthomonadales bacterium]
MSEYDYDLFVIGAGSGGVRASRIAAGYGARVAVCEEDRVGGTCVIRGCVPKKLMVYAAHFHEDFEDAAGFGWEVGQAEFDWNRLIAAKDHEIDRLNGVYKNILASAGVELIEQRGELVDAHTVQLGDRQVTADKILIAVGGWPTKPPVPGAELAITSTEAFHLDSLPPRVVVYGGGYIAVEFAGIFNGLGSEVTQVYRGPQVLRGFDRDVREVLGQELIKKGIHLCLDTNIIGIEECPEGTRVHLSGNDSIDCDLVMFATGRAPKIDGLGLENAGVETDAGGAIVVDEFSRTSVDNIYAVGDVTNRINLTPVALMEGHAFARTVFGNDPVPVDHASVPSAVFSQPPVATVGLTEHDARDQLGEIDVYRSTFRPLKHTLSGRDEQTMMKLIVERQTQRVVGCHIVGLDAAEMLQGVAIAIKMGATKSQFDAVIGIHPTAAEELVTMRNKVEC